MTSPCARGKSSPARSSKTKRANIVLVAGWSNQHQMRVDTFRDEKCGRREQRGRRRFLPTTDQRCRLAAKVKLLHVSSVGFEGIAPTEEVEDVPMEGRPHVYVRG